MSADVRRVLAALGAFVAAFAWADSHLHNHDVGVPAFAVGMAFLAIALIRD